MPEDLGGHYRLQHLDVRFDLGMEMVHFVERTNDAEAQRGISFQQILQQNTRRRWRPDTH